MLNKPWLNEPNLLEWKSRIGSDCLILRNSHMGFLCGYVRADYLNYTPVEFFSGVSVHGGITFSGELENRVGWWIGFDCGHFRDMLPYESTTRGIYRDMIFVKEQCEVLSEQLSRYTPTQKPKNEFGEADYGYAKSFFHDKNIMVPATLEEFLELTNQMELDPDLTFGETLVSIVTTLCYLNVGMYPHEVKAIMADLNIESATLRKIINILT